MRSSGRGALLRFALVPFALAACERAPEGPSRREQALEDLAALEAAIEAWARDHDGRPPAELEPLVRPLPDGRHYLPSGTPALFDPFGRRYLYSPEDGGFALESLGRDGERGGSGDDADLSRADLASED